MNDFVRYKLINLVKNYNSQIYKSSSRCRGFLNDFCGDYKREVFVLSTAVEEKVPTELLKYKAGNKFSLQSLIVRLKENLKKDYAFTEYASLWAVESWALALNIITVSENDYLATVKRSQANDNLKKSLFFFALTGKLELINDLIKLGVNININDEKKRTPLIYAVISGHRKIVARLLELDVDIGCRDDTGYTALHWAVMLGEEKIVKLLLAAGADKEKKTHNGINVLSLASRYQQLDIQDIIKNFN